MSFQGSPGGATRQTIGTSDTIIASAGDTIRFMGSGDATDVGASSNQYRLRIVKVSN